MTPRCGGGAEGGGGLALLAVELRSAGGAFVAVVPWASVPWRETQHTVAAQPKRAGKPATPRRVVLARTVGAEELAAWRVCGDCYLAGYAVTVRGEVAK